jgi:UDP-N-acetylglucosamine 2-epimerase
MPDAVVLHTGQHYSPTLSEVFLTGFGIKVDKVLRPDHNSSVEALGPLSRAMEDWCSKRRGLGIAAVYGDTLSSSAAAIGAKRAGWQELTSRLGCALATSLCPRKWLVFTSTP